MSGNNGWKPFFPKYTTIKATTILSKNPKNPFKEDFEWLPGPGPGQGPGPKPFPPRPFPPWTTPFSPFSTDSGDENDSLFSEGDIGFILSAMMLVFIMIPGLGFFYSGLSKGQSALNLILICFWSLALVSVQWFLFGYSLTFSDTGGNFIGNFDHAFFIGVDGFTPSPLSEKIPSILFAVYQGMFAGITPALIFGGAAERFRFLPATIFILIWTTVVYDFLAYWTWNSNGWAEAEGGLDFAGGTPVHISSGAASLSYALVLGKRKTTESSHTPHNMASVFLGTALLWFGWFGFNGGSALSANSQAVFAIVATNLAACTGGITWTLLEYGRSRVYSGAGFCSGAVAGLVTVTPGCGFISPASSLAFGFAGALSCFLAVTLMRKCSRWCDDALDVFSVHGVGGIVGNILTGVFAQEEYGGEIEGGGLDGNWYQIVHQIIDSAAGFGWSFLMTTIILVVLNYCFPGMSLRLPEREERVGPDITQHGEHCYDFVQREQKHQHHHGIVGNGNGNVHSIYTVECKESDLPEHEQTKEEPTTKDSSTNYAKLRKKFRQMEAELEAGRHFDYEQNILQQHRC